MSIKQSTVLPFDSILDKIHSGFFILDSDWSIVYVNKAIEGWVGKKREELVGSNIWDALPAIIPFSHFYHKARNEQVPISIQDYYEPTGKWLLVKLEPYQNGLVGYVCDYTEAKKKELTIQHMADHDDLTGLPNRRLFEKKMAALFEESTSFALIYLDIDRFKVINDALGHELGDQLIIEFSNRLRYHVGEDNFVGRQSSDEFVVILDRHHDPAAAAKRIKQLMESKPILAGNTELFFTISMGISLYPEHGKDAGTLLKKANLAMYHTKAQGGNSIQFYNRDVDTDWFKKLTLEKALREAIDGNQLRLYYQPRVDARTGEICSFEALTRWIHPEWGMMMPMDFIPVAEETGLINPLTDWVKRTALGQLRKWLDEGITPVPISVNIPSKYFLAESFTKDVQHLLGEMQIDGKWLEIEITETGILNNEHLVASRIEELKALGVKILIDDFGTGYSSLAYLSHYNVDMLKVDRSFISDIICNSSNAIITKAIIELAHGLGKMVVAEGVETCEQLTLLQNLSCDQIQGFLFSRPVPDTQLCDLMKKRFLTANTVPS